MDAEPEAPLITDEVFDFDLPLSPDRGEEENVGQDDEVFFGPVGFTEKCVAAGVAEETIKPLSPLHLCQWAEVRKEAYSVAYRIANSETCSSEGSTAESPALSSFQKQLGTLQRRVQENQTHALCSGEASRHVNLENISPEKRQKCSGVFTKELPVHTLPDNCSPKKEYKRKGTFIKEEPVQNLLSLFQVVKPGSEERRNQKFQEQDPKMVSTLKVPSLQLMKCNSSQPSLTKCESGIPVVRGRKRALPVLSQKTSVASVSNENGGRKDENLPAQAAVSQKSTGISRVPSTKSQLMRPGHLQRKSLAFVRCKTAAPEKNGPLKVPPQPALKMGSTVERPYNPALAAAAASSGNSQHPSTPSGQKQVVPKMQAFLASDSSTPAKSSCSSSSSFGSKPESLIKGMSFLPTPLKQRSQPTCSRSSSSNNKSKLSLASSSSACDSPVFDLNTSNNQLTMQRSSAFKASYGSTDTDNPEASPFPFKPRKPLVQNTPDLPKRTLSRWSPLRRQPVRVEDEVSMCTKKLQRPI